MNTIDLSGGWDKVWSNIQSAMGGLGGLLTAVGVLLVVFAVVKWFWDKRRGGGAGGQGTSAVMWAVAIGCLFAAPGLIIPLILNIIDVVANAVINIWKSGGTS